MKKLALFIAVPISFTGDNNTWRSTRPIRPRERFRTFNRPAGAIHQLQEIDFRIDGDDAVVSMSLGCLADNINCVDAIEKAS